MNGSIQATPTHSASVSKTYGSSPASAAGFGDWVQLPAALHVEAVTTKSEENPHLWCKQFPFHSLQEEELLVHSL